MLTTQGLSETSILTNPGQTYDLHHQSVLTSNSSPLSSRSPQTIHNYAITLQDIKSQLSSINQQLSTTQSININTDFASSHQPILIQLSSQLEQQCDQFLTVQHQFQLQLHQQQLELKQQQINFENNIKQQQLEFKQQQVDILQQIKQEQLDLKELKLELKQQQQLLLQEQQLQLKQLQMNFDIKINQQQSNIDQQLSELKQRQLDFELEMKQKQQDFELECQRREFELSKQEFRLKQQQSQQQQPILLHHSINESYDLQGPTSSISSQPQHDQLQQQIQNLTLSTNNNDEQNAILLEIIQDYQAMKYLVQENVTTEKSLTEHVQQLNDIQSKLITRLDKIELKIPIIDQISMIGFESLERQHILSKFQQNKKLNISTFSNQSVFICYQFENLSNVRLSCKSASNATIRGSSSSVFDGFVRTDLQQYESTINSGKLYVSTKSVLNGQWIQMQGDRLLVFNEVELFHLIKPGDEVPYDEVPCPETCTTCKGKPSDTSSKRFLIKFRWEP